MVIDVDQPSTCALTQLFIGWYGPNGPTHDSCHWSKKKDSVPQAERRFTFPLLLQIDLMDVSMCKFSLSRSQ